MPPVKSPYPPYNYDYFIEGKIKALMPPQVKGFPECAAWCKAFTDKAQELTAGLDLTGWHKVEKETWQVCANYANENYTSMVEVVGVKLDKNRSINGHYIWSQH